MPRSVDPPSCVDVLERLEALIDGDLEESSARAIGRHLASCPACRDEMDLARQVQLALHELPERELPEHVIDAVAAATRSGGFAARRQRSPGILSIRPLHAALVAAAAVLLIAVLTPRQGTAPPQARSEVERVTAETRLALAYLGSAAKRAERRVAVRLVEGEAMATTVGSISRSVNLVRRSAGRSGSE